MSDRTDPAWDEYLSTGEDPTGGELEGYDEEGADDEILEGEWQQYERTQRKQVSGKMNNQGGSPKKTLSE